jgi:hypothetical protein
VRWYHCRLPPWGPSGAGAPADEPEAFVEGAGPDNPVDPPQRRLPAGECAAEQALTVGVAHDQGRAAMDLPVQYRVEFGVVNHASEPRLDLGGEPEQIGDVGADGRLDRPQCTVHTIGSGGQTVGNGGVVTR